MGKVIAFAGSDCERLARKWHHGAASLALRALPLSLARRRHIRAILSAKKCFPRRSPIRRIQEPLDK